MTADPKLTEHEFSRRSAQVVALMYDSLDFAIFSTIIILHFSFLFVPGLYALYLLSLHVTPLSRPKYIWYVCVCVWSFCCCRRVLSIVSNPNKKKISNVVCRLTTTGLCLVSLLKVPLDTLGWRWGGLRQLLLFQGKHC